jgi:thiol-disulfide isomerase/thioredoxin
VGLAGRVGAAIVSPRAALEAADRGEGGSPDALRLLLLKFVSTETRTIVAALWTAMVNGVSVGLPPLLGRLSAAVGVDLLMILVAGVIITVAAGRKRSPSRDFDLAVVAWVPVLLITSAGSLIQVIFDCTLPAGVAYAVTGVALAWMIGLIVVAIRVARGRVAATESSTSTFTSTTTSTTTTTKDRVRSGAGTAVIGVLCAILAVNVLFVIRHGELLRPLRSGDLAPSSFSLRGANVPGYGGLVALRGHVVLIDFWAHWCGPCREGMPHVQRLYAKHHEQGFEVLSINVPQERSETGVHRALEEAGVTFPVYYDDGKAQALYNAYTLPTMVLVDKHGFIRDSHAERRLGSLDARIAQLLAEP